MRRLNYDPEARKRTVSLTLKKVRAEISQDLGAYNAYVEKHGSPAEMLREHLTDRDDTA
jgi:hypothetical protein